jgi:hypothetical protein
VPHVPEERRSSLVIIAARFQAHRSLDFDTDIRRQN